MIVVLELLLQDKINSIKKIDVNAFHAFILTVKYEAIKYTDVFLYPHHVNFN